MKRAVILHAMKQTSQGHFSTSLDARFTKLPELIKILEERDLL